MRLGRGYNSQRIALANGMRKRAGGENGFAEISRGEEEDRGHAGAIGGRNVNAKSTKRLRARSAQPK